MPWYHAKELSPELLAFLTAQLGADYDLRATLFWYGRAERVLRWQRESPSEAGPAGGPPVLLARGAFPIPHEFHEECAQRF